VINLYEVNWIVRLLTDAGLTPVEVDINPDDTVTVTLRLPRTG
jgi:hypothetical protein